MNRFLTFLLLTFLLFPSLSGQEAERFLGLEAFLERVTTYHPQAQRADLILDMADANLRRAKGAFDPRLEGDLAQKYFDEKTYYSYLDGGLTWPTQLGGLTFKAGYEMASGINQNPEYATPGAGLVRAGAYLPLGQGLLIDPARAGLRLAEIGMNAAPVARQARLNDLLYDAASAYWDWAEAFGRVDILQRGADIARQRLEWIQNTSSAGDLPAIDTLKAMIQLQQRLLDRDQARLDLIQSRTFLQIFLWEDERRPWEQGTPLVPQAPLTVAEVAPLGADSLMEILSELNFRHPDLQTIRYELASLQIERRLKAEKLKPKLNIEYAALNEPIAPQNGGVYDPRLFTNNYKWGFQMSFPLFLREARGDLGLTKIKIEDMQWKQDEKSQELWAKVRIYAEQLSTLYAQLELSEQNVSSYQQLLEAEDQLFRQGESSLFEINIWESQLIEAELKLLGIQAKYAKTQAALAWAAGQLGIDN